MINMDIIDRSKSYFANVKDCETQMSENCCSKEYLLICRKHLTRQPERRHHATGAAMGVKETRGK